ncbi:MAG: helix-turn-helix transcriptional regulator [Alphaproteobacteria bacterium]|nr:helix-turn-helix transcriptional regulator [Alphaproteobacteria bacterium]
MTDARALHKRWMKSAGYRKAYADLAAEFELASELIAARAAARLTQKELARRMRTTQSAIARMESGRHWPSKRTLERFARATGTRPVIKLVRLPSRKAS